MTRWLRPAPPAEPVPARAYVRRELAMSCLDCEAIFEAAGDQHCPACGSAQAFSVARVLNRKAVAA